MAKLIKATVSYTMQCVSVTDCDKFGQPYGTIEVLDSDNFRDSFHESEESAVERVKESVEDALGLSGGVALGAVAIEVVDAE